MSDVSIPWTIISAFAGGASGAAGLSWWLATKFNNVYQRMNASENRLIEKIITNKDLIIEKINSHEDLDNERFENQKLAIMRIELSMQTAGLINPLQLPPKRS